MNEPAQRERRPTIIEVAKLAGVSFKTVARVLNGEPGVKADKREAVKRAVKMLDYVPNVSARRLAGERSFLLALLFDIPSDYVARAQSGAITRCREAGYHLIVEEVPAGFEVGTAKRLHDLRIDGVILTPGLARNATMTKALRTLGIRQVLLSPEAPDSMTPSVQMDDYLAAYEITKLLIGLGHQEIAFISGGERPSSRRRHAGCKAALEDSGLTLRPEFDCVGDFGFKSGEAGGNKLLGQKNRPTAVFAANDTMAFAVMVSAARFGIHIPSQLSVVGFDDSPLASVVSPQLTTVRQPLRSMANAAVELLLDRNPSTEPPPALTFDFRIVERESTAAIG